MLLNEQQLIGLVGCTKNTLRLKLFREEFLHIKKFFIGYRPRIYFYKHVKEHDIIRLKDVVKRKIKKENYEKKEAQL